MYESSWIHELVTPTHLLSFHFDEFYVDFNWIWIDIHHINPLIHIKWFYFGYSFKDKQRKIYQIFLP